MAAPPPTTEAASPPPRSASPASWMLVGLLMRVLTLICLFISLVIITTTKATLPIDLYSELKFKFNDVYGFRYMLFTILIGGVYALFQIALTVYQMTLRKRLISGYGFCLFEFYGDKIISYILATGTAAAFGASVDMKEVLGARGSSIDKFFNKANAAASILLFGFLFSAVSSVFSSLALPKRE